jgi:hypothetical protein
MAHRDSCTLIRKARRHGQEGRDYPVHRLYFAVASNSISSARMSMVPAEQSYQQQIRRSAATFACDGARTGMMAGLARTTHSNSLPFSFSNIAVEIMRSRMAIVAKQEEFCCGPRQGN